MHIPCLTSNASIARAKTVQRFFPFSFFFFSFFFSFFFFFATMCALPYGDIQKTEDTATQLLGLRTCFLCA
jgi:hypothetical protein